MDAQDTTFKTVEAYQDMTVEQLRAATAAVPHETDPDPDPPKGV